MPALMQKEPVFLIKVGPKKGPGSFRVQNNIYFGPPRRGQIRPVIAAYEQETDPIIPGTIGESKLEAVCGLN